MFKKLLSAALLIAAMLTAYADDGQKIASKVQKVIVFLNGAQVTRTATVNIVPGTAELIFDGIAPGIDAQSIQVHANGAFTILSVRHELNYLNEPVNQKQLDDLQAARKALADKISLQNSILSIYQQEEDMLTKNELGNSQNVGFDVIKLKAALDFHTERLTEIKQKELAIGNDIAALEAEAGKYDKQIAETGKTKSSVTSNVIVTVSSKITVQSQFTISYVVKNTSWFPTYDIRAKDINSPVSISYKANVSQKTGEDWKNVKLTLSTGNPTVSGNMPGLKPYFLNTNMFYINDAGTTSRVTGRIFDSKDNQSLPGASIRIKGTSIGAVSDVNGNFSLQVPPSGQTLVVSYIGYTTQELQVSGQFLNIPLNPASNALNEVVVVGYSANGSSDYTDRVLQGQAAGVAITVPLGVTKSENQTNVEFNIDVPYSIPTDGKQYLVEINETDLKASFQYAVAPKISTDVFLTAKLTDWNKYNFLSGEANLFFEGTYIGKSLIDTYATADTLNLSMGIDKNIVVTRTLAQNLDARQTLGSNKKETRDWVLDVRNRKNQPVSLLVEDQVPVSQSSAITVEVLETSGAKPDVSTGAVSWNLLLNSQDEKKLQLKYQVKYPKNDNVIVQ